MEIVAAQYEQLYEILAVVFVFIFGLGWWLIYGNKLGWIFIAGAAAYAWFNIIQPLLLSR